MNLYPNLSLKINSLIISMIVFVCVSHSFAEPFTLDVVGTWCLEQTIDQNESIVSPENFTQTLIINYDGSFAVHNSEILLNDPTPVHGQFYVVSEYIDENSFWNEWTISLEPITSIDIDLQTLKYNWETLIWIKPDSTFFESTYNRCDSKDSYVGF